MYQSTSFHTVPPPGTLNAVPQGGARGAARGPSMSMRLRRVLLLLALLVLVLAAASWLLLRAYQSGHAAQEQAVRIASLAAARLLDRQEPRAANAEQALAAVQPLLEAGWSGFLVDSAGRAVPAGTAAATGQPALPADFSERLASSLAHGWLDVPDAQGGTLRVFFSRTAQGWTWVSWVPCSALDPACSPLLRGVIWAAIVLFALAGLGLAGLALRGRADPMRPARRSQAGGAPGERDNEAGEAHIQNERLQVVGRLAGRFSHEFNNQLGVLSNSAYLIERRSEDPNLRLPAQAMLRSVDTASRLTQQLLRFGPRHSTHALVVDLYRWLPGVRGTLAVVLGKRVALEVAEPAEASPPGQPAARLGVYVDPDELELALISIFLSVREALPDGARVRMAAHPVGGHLAASAAKGEQVEIRIEAVAHWQGAGPGPEGAGPGESGAAAEAGEAGVVAAASAEAPQRPQESRPGVRLSDADADASCGLALARRLCLAGGGVAWAEGGSGGGDGDGDSGGLAVSLVLPRVPMAAQDCLAQSLD